jgi:hypothetical protein
VLRKDHLCVPLYYVLYDIYIYDIIWMWVKIQSMDQGPGPTHDPYSMIHTPIHTP